MQSGPAADDDGLADVRISSLSLRGLCEALQTSGISVDTFLSRAQLDAARVADRDTWFTLTEFDEALQQAVVLSGDPAFGLHWAERSPMMQLDLVPTLVAAAPTLRDTIDSVLQLQLLFANRAQCVFSERRGRSALQFDVLAISSVALRMMSELALGGLVRMFHYLGEDVALRRINVRYARPPYGFEYERMFGAKLHFEQSQTSVEFASGALERRFALRSDELYRSVSDRAEELRQRVLGELSYAAQLEGHIRAALPRVLSMEEAARAIGMSGRSLRRRLEQEQLSYTELVDDIQRRRANELLSQGSKSVKEVAHALGFESTSGFHRAFRRWTGNSPGRARSPRARSPGVQ